MSKEEGRNRQAITVVLDGVSMVTSAGYQKIEAPSVCLHSAPLLAIQKRKVIFLFFFLPTILYVALYFAVPLC